MVKIYFKKEDVTIAIEAGTTILQAAKKAGVLIESPCDAIGTCGKCKVRLEKVDDDRTMIREGQVYHRVTEEEESRGIVLASRLRYLGILLL